MLRIRLMVKDDSGRAKIEAYAGRAPLASWLRVAIVRTASTLRRNDRVQENRRSEGPPPALAVVDPELAMIQRRYGDEFNDALRSAFDALSTEHRMLLRLRFVDGLNLAKIAAVMNVSRATSGRTMIGARERLYAETARLLRERLGVNDQELESLLLLVRSKLDISLKSALSPKVAP